LNEKAERIIGGVDWSGLRVACCDPALFQLKRSIHSLLAALVEEEEVEEEEEEEETEAEEVEGGGPGHSVCHTQHSQTTFLPFL